MRVRTPQPGWIVAEPAPQLGARRQVLHPSTDRRFRLAEPARPEPIDQDANTVVGRRRLIDPLDPDIERLERLLHAQETRLHYLGS